jgi:hypothetical protein
MPGLASSAPRGRGSRAEVSPAPAAGIRRGACSRTTRPRSPSTSCTVRAPKRAGSKPLLRAQRHTASTAARNGHAQQRDALRRGAGVARSQFGLARHPDGRTDPRLHFVGVVPAHRGTQPLPASPGGCAWVTHDVDGAPRQARQAAVAQGMAVQQAHRHATREVRPQPRHRLERQVATERVAGHRGEALTAEQGHDAFAARQQQHQPRSIRRADDAPPVGGRAGCRAAGVGSPQDCQRPSSRGVLARHKQSTGRSVSGFGSQRRTTGWRARRCPALQAALAPGSATAAFAP